MRILCESRSWIPAFSSLVHVWHYVIVLTTQDLPPIEPPKPMPAPQTTATTLRVTTTEVLVPTLVEKKGGGIVYGLKQGDFVLEDNGVPQKIRVQEEMDTAPVALGRCRGTGRRQRTRVRQARQARPAPRPVPDRPAEARQR